jgi:shikimate dehydrogenase
MFSAGAIAADNTDGPGLAQSLAQALPRPVAGRRAVVVGAGGSARSAVWALRDAGAEVMVYNRSPARAEALCADLGGIPVTEIPPGEVLVNCTAVGLHGESLFEAMPLRRETLTSYGCVVDFVYAPGGTALIAAAREVGVATVTGLELLIAQGALAFELFTGQPASLAAMRDAVGTG